MIEYAICGRDSEGPIADVLFATSVIDSDTVTDSDKYTGVLN